MSSELPGVEVLRFGEFMVAQQAIDRAQLLRALQLQDLRPHLRIGDATVELGVLGQVEVALLHEQFLCRR